MKQRVRATWSAMKHDPPGERFQRQYHRRQREAERRRHLLHYLTVVALILVGVVLMFIPGPAVVMFGLAAALLAEDSLRIAKALDWLELKIRALVRVA